MLKRPTLVVCAFENSLWNFRFLHVCLAFRPFVDENAQSNPNRPTPSAKGGENLLNQNAKTPNSGGMYFSSKFWNFGFYMFV